MKPLLIGITGGIGSGKTTVSNLLRAKGYHVYDADSEARCLQDEDKIVRQQIIEIFGNDIYDFSDKLNRALLAEIVFNDAEKLQQLTNIVHPAIKTDFKKWIANHSNERLLFQESAILFESGFYTLFDKIIVVTASEKTRTERVMLRDNITRQQVRERMARQLPEKKLLTHADFIIRTDDQQSLEEKVEEIITEIRAGI